MRFISAPELDTPDFPFVHLTTEESKKQNRTLYNQRKLLKRYPGAAENASESAYDRRFFSIETASAG
jgi:hypothetical protein